MTKKQAKTALETTISGVKKPGADFMVLVRKIQEKVITYGVCSNREQEILEQYTDFGQHKRTPK